METPSKVENKWTAKDMPNLSGKVIIVTGANSGIGFEATKEFTRKGAKTILASRNLTKANAAMEKIRKEIPEADMEVMILDLSSLKSIHEFVEKFKANYSQLDILLNNAGIMFVPYKTTEGHTEIFCLNMLNAIV